MSFRKRSEIIGGAPSAVNRSPPVMNRGPTPSIRQPVPSNSLRNPSQINKQQDDISILNNPSVRPSLITSQPTTSTGSSDLDRILLHQGLPLGNSLLIEESGTTDFASVLLRAFASQGIVHNRISETVNSHIIVLGMNPQWSSDLPGLYKGTSKEQKKAKIVENESKISVSNLSSTSAPTSATTGRDMKIAWRYGLNKKTEKNEVNENSTYENYNHQFDITQKLTPGPNTSDITYIPLQESFQKIINQIESIIKTHIKMEPTKVIRLIIPNILNPSLYPALTCLPTFIFPFIHSLRSILRRYNNNLVLITSLSLDLYPRDQSLALVLETLFDSIIHLQPFNQAMSQLIEKAYKNEPSKIQQGLVNIIKVPVLSEKGLMMIHDGEYAFKNGRKKFEIEEWGIPVEDDAKENNTTSEGGQTTKNIDF